MVELPVMMVMATSSFTSAPPMMPNSHNIQILRITAQSKAASGWNIPANADRVNAKARRFSLGLKSATWVNPMVNKTGDQSP